MQIYYASITLIEQKTMQLDSERCTHCGKAQQMVSHGFIYKKQGHQQDLLACSVPRFHRIVYQIKNHTIWQGLERFTTI